MAAIRAADVVRKSSCAGVRTLLEVGRRDGLILAGANPIISNIAFAGAPEPFHTSPKPRFAESTRVPDCVHHLTERGPARDDGCRFSCGLQRTGRQLACWIASRLPSGVRQTPISFNSSQWLRRAYIIAGAVASGRWESLHAAR